MVMKRSALAGFQNGYCEDRKDGRSDFLNVDLLAFF